MTNPEILLADLEATDAWIRALARRLVRNEDDAEDVAQDAWVRLLSRRPDRRRPVRRWMTTIIRNLAIGRHRSEVNRRGREKDVARTDEVPSVDDLWNEEQLRRKVANAVFALEEPYRTAVLLRYFRGRSPREIAARLGVSPAAVESRLRRGLDKLRARLDRDFGGRSAWCVALAPLTVPLAGEASLAGAAAALTGGAIMSAKVKAGLVAVLLVCGMIAFWSVRGTPPVNEEDAARRPGPTPLKAGVATVREDATKERIAREPEAPSPEAPAGTATGTVADVFTSGIVVDENDRPVPGAAIYRLPPKRLLSEWTFAELAAKLGTPVITDASGRFRIGSRAPESTTTSVVSLLAHADGFAARQFERVAIGARDQRLVLRRAIVLSGRVTREEDGRPVAGATLTWRAGRGPAGMQLGRTRSAADGSFQLDGVPRHSTSMVEVALNGFAPVLFRVPYEEEVLPPITVTLTRGRDLEGHVVDGDDRRPIERAKVELWVYENAGAGWDGWHGYGVRMLARTTTDADGRFRFRHVEPPGGCAPKGFRPYHKREIGVWIDARGRAPAWVAIDDEGALPEIALYRSGAIHGLVVDRYGHPLPGAYVVAIVDRAPLVRSDRLRTRRFHRRLPFDRRDHDSDPPWQGHWCAVTGDDGRYVIERVAAPEAIGRVVRMHLESRMWPEVSTRVAIMPGKTVVADPMTHPDPPTAWINGRTVDEDGKAVAGAAVTLGNLPAISDGDGRFRVPYPARDIDGTGTMRQLWVRHPDFATRSVPVSRDWIGEDETRIVLRRGVRLVGTVVDGQGRPVVGATVWVRSDREPVAVRYGHIARERVTTGQTRETGRFSIGPIPAGPVALLVGYPAGIRPAFTVRGSLVAGGPPQVVTLRELTVAQLTRVRVRIRIVDDPSGKPVTAAATVALWNSGIRCAKAEACNGVADLRDVFAPQDYVVRAEVDGFGVVERPIRVGSHAQDQEHLIAVGGGGGTIRVTIAGLRTQPRKLRVLVIAADGRRFFVTRDGAGRFEARGLAPGPYSVRLDSWKLPPPEQVAAVPRPAIVSAGATVDIALQATPAARLDVHLLGHDSRPGDVGEQVTWRLPPSYANLPYIEWMRQGISIEVRDRHGHLWYDGPPNTGGHGRLSKSPQPGLRLLVSAGTYDVVVRRRGIVLGRGTATTEVPSRVWADLYR